MLAAEAATTEWPNTRPEELIVKAGFLGRGSESLPTSWGSGLVVMNIF